MNTGVLGPAQTQLILDQAQIHLCLGQAQTHLCLGLPGPDPSGLGEALTHLHLGQAQTQLGLDYVGPDLDGSWPGPGPDGSGSTLGQSLAKEGAKQTNPTSAVGSDCDLRTTALRDPGRCGLQIGNKTQGPQWATAIGQTMWSAATGQWAHGPHWSICQMGPHGLIDGPCGALLGLASSLNPTCRLRM